MFTVFILVGVIFGFLIGFLYFDKQLRKEREDKQDRDWKILILEKKLLQVSFLYPKTTNSKFNSQLSN